ncbi:WecB/TagA/CpsF family glycosyltransferase [Zobellia laminariae]|uniref:WecB/TagA/CpsF family glycosyltransferase n=1 Tax=Zobellia laminariae TaxID=248906 RepID=UPI0026F4121D|nr:WecB/TagA/CpsF family glycosyltransferase [Zobellia laminariae]WKX78326.1 WecB/TagA/CpsF family glycosyltransferase [Zobellia laminariae]
MVNKSKVDCLGYSIFDGTLNQLPKLEKTLIGTINQYSYCIAEEDPDFKEALMQSDVLIPDGIGIVLASKFLYGKKIKKIAGADIHEFLLEKLNREGGSCFYLGSSKDTLSKIKKRISIEYPNISIGTYSPPFKPAFSLEENAKMLEEVNQFKPDVLFVGMTAPKQEKWSYTNKEFLNAKTICSIGAVFDFYAGTIERPSEIWINLGLEWLGRLLKEPKRMWKRYLYYGVIFGKYLVIEKWKLKDIKSQ